MDSKYVLPLSDPRADIETVGGKGASLSQLSRAGLPVPGGFYITTAAYRLFASTNSLQPFILDAVSRVDISKPAALEEISRQIRDRFMQGTIPNDLSISISLAYENMSGIQPGVAVRSSATAEDLPGASFAGQQETYLNIQRLDDLMDAVRKCWASLWTARAIAYRTKNDIDQDSVALAVVVQEMVNADAAGILFTANPVNGMRSQMLINAAWGLGEAVVSGAVTPDTVVVEKSSGKILKSETAEKLVMTVRTETGTKETAVPEQQRKKPVLTKAQSVELARLGEKIESHYGAPMDVEWALSTGKFSILQARPITTLKPEWTRPNPKAVYARGSLAEHLPNPVTPLFGTLGMRTINLATSELSDFMNIDLLAMDYQYRTVNGYVFLGFKMTAEFAWKMTKASFGAMKIMYSNVKGRWHQARQELKTVMARWEERDVRRMSAQEILEGVEEVYTQLGRLYTVLQASTLPVSTTSEIIFSRVYRLARRKGDPEATAFLFGFDTVPMMSEKALFDLSVWVKEQPALAVWIQEMPREGLVAALEVDQAPGQVPLETWTEWKERFQSYMHDYGSTVYELDFANPTPAETPAPVLDVIKMHLDGKGQNPYERQREAVKLREQSTQMMLKRLRWPLKGWFIKSLKWAQDVGPAREDSLIDLGMANPLVRKMLGELGRRLAEGGVLELADDIYWLEEDELRKVSIELEAIGKPIDLRSRVQERKAIWQEQLKLVPPAMLPERSKWAKIIPWQRTDQGGDSLKGYAASPGKITAKARVLLSPSDFDKMEPGDVLVAVTTTPAWTPLFAMASAVVTDIGGPLSHSSIVAREYGIPAVMATGMATRRIQDRQLITVDGSAGVVLLQGVEPGNGKAAG